MPSAPISPFFMRDLRCAEHVEIIGHDADRGIGFVIRARLFEMFSCVVFDFISLMMRFFLMPYDSR